MIYFIKDNNNGNIKIGRTINLKQRFNTLNNSHSKKLSILGIIEVKKRTKKFNSFDSNRDLNMEKLLHLKFDKYRIKKTEWFLPNKEIDNYIKKYTKKYEEDIKKLKITVDKKEVNLLKSFELIDCNKIELDFREDLNNI